MRKVQLSVWVEPKTKEALLTLAKDRSKRGEEVTLSDVVNEILDQAIDGQLEQSYERLLGTRLENTLKREIGKMANRMAPLLSRTAVEACATRQAFTHEIRVAKGDEYAKQLTRASNKTANSTLRNPDLKFRELVQEFLNGDQDHSNGQL
jgi:hypothetical protein